MRRIVAIAVSVAFLALLFAPRASATTGDGPRILVTPALDEVSVFGIETIAVSSRANNTTASIGPVSIEVYGSGGKTNVGCVRCNLTNGIAVLTLQIDEHFPTGTILVVVRDFHTNLTGTGTFTAIVGSTYLLYLWKKSLKDLNDSAQAQLSQSVAANNTQAEEIAGLEVLVLVVALLVLQHRYARGQGVRSWIDRRIEKFRLHRGHDTFDLLMRPEDSWARYIPKEIERDAVKRERFVRLAALVELARRMEACLDLRKEDRELTKMIEHTRVMAGLSPQDSFDKWKPGMEKPIE